LLSNQLSVFGLITPQTGSLNPKYLKISGDKGKTKLVYFYDMPKKKSTLTLFNIAQLNKCRRGA
jgi:hypothetical protein